MGNVGEELSILFIIIMVVRKPVKSLKAISTDAIPLVGLVKVLFG